MVKAPRRRTYAPVERVQAPSQANASKLWQKMPSSVLVTYQCSINNVNMWKLNLLRVRITIY